MRAVVIELELRSGLGTPLAADTLWGHLAWGLRYAEGVGALESWLDEYDQGSPPLVLSDPLPRGFWPAPQLPPPALPETPPDLAAFDRRKRAAKAEWIASDRWGRLSGALDAATLVEALGSAMDAGDTPPAFCGLEMTHAGINRLTGGTAQPGGGLLHTSERRYAATPTRWQVWTLTTMPDDRLRTVVEAGLSGGYGRDAGGGLGVLELIEIRQAGVPAPADANACVLLAPATPAPSDPAKGFTPLGIRCGRLGGLFAGQATPSGSTQRQKRPITVIERGSVLVSRNPPAFVGRVLRAVHDDPAIRHYAMAPVLPCRLCSPDALAAGTALFAASARSGAPE